MSWGCASVFYSWMRSFPPSIMRSAVPHLFSKDLSLTTVDVPAWIEIVMCLSVVLEACCCGFHVSGNGIVGFCWMWWPVLVYFIISEGVSSSGVGELFAGGWSYISPSTFLKLLWLDWHCLLIIGIYSCHPTVVCFRNLYYFLKYTHPVGYESSCQVPSFSEEDSARVLNRL